MINNRMAAGVLGGLLLTVGLAAQASAAEAERDPTVERGRYLVVVSGCNDCHTPGYMQNGGPKLPEKAWLTGAPVGRQILDVDRTRDRVTARRRLDLPEDRFVVAVMGGSQGSGVLNEAIWRIAYARRDDLVRGAIAAVLARA